MPNHLKDATRDGKALGHGKGYKYPHNHPDHYLPQQYLPKDLLGTYFYTPSNQGYEQAVEARLQAWREAQRKALGITETEALPDLDDQEVQTIKRRHKPTGSRSKR